MSTNVGSQQISVKYHDPVNSDIVNARFFDVRAVGIYKGGHITYSGSTASISPMVFEIKDKDGAINQIRAETMSTVSLAGQVSSAPYVVARWTHEEDSSGDYGEFLGVATPEETDVVIGKLLFSGVNIIGVEYTERTFANNRGSFCKVVPYDTDSSTLVYVLPGVIPAITGDGYILIYDCSVSISGKTPYAFIYVKSDGQVYVTNTSSDTYGHILLAKINNDGTTITEKDITDLRCFLSFATRTDNTTIEYSGTGELRIKDSGVSVNKIGVGAVTETKIGTGAVTETKIGTGAVTETKIGADAVITSKIKDSAVTIAKIDPVAVVTELETITANDVDSKIPTCAAVKAYVDAVVTPAPSGTGEQTFTYSNGLILKMGTASGLNSAADNVVTFAVPFPTACINIVAIDSIDSGGYGEKFRIKKADITKDHFHCDCTLSGTSEINWQAWGY